MDSFAYLLIFLVIAFALLLITGLLWNWCKIEKKFQNDDKKKSIEKIEANKNNDKTRDVNNQMIRKSDVNDKSPESMSRGESSVSDKDFDQTPVSPFGEGSQVKSTTPMSTLSTITCTGSQATTQSTLTTNTLKESFSDYSPNTFRSPKNNVINETLEDLQSKSEDIKVDIPEDNSSEETITKSVEN